MEEEEEARKLRLEEEKEKVDLDIWEMKIWNIMLHFWALENKWVFFIYFFKKIIYHGM